MTNELAATQPATNAGNMQLVAQNTTDVQLVRLWLSSGKRAGSTATQDTYRRIVDRFFAAVGKPLQAVTLTDLQYWRESLTGSAATQRTHIAAVRSLFAFAVKVGYLRMSPAVMLETPKVQQQQDARTLTQADTLRLFDACQTAQETALVRLLYGSGCRVSEALALTWQDVQPRQHGAGAVLRIRDGKGGKARQAGINAAAYAAILALRTEDTQPTAFVFATRNGTALDRHAAHNLLKRVLSRAGLKDAVPDRVSCHWLRHTHATHAIAAGAPLTDVQAQLGHASLATTTIYAHSMCYSSDKLPL